MKVNHEDFTIGVANLGSVPRCDKALQYLRDRPTLSCPLSGSMPFVITA